MKKKYLIFGIVIVLIIAAGVIYYWTNDQTKNLPGDNSPWLNAYYHGDYKKTVELLKPLAADGNTNAMYNLGILYLKGLGVGKNINTAIKYFEKAASNNNVLALNGLGNIYFVGLEGVKKDYNKAVKYYSNAMALSQKENDTKQYALSIYNLSACYFEGKGTAKDYRKGLELLKKSADYGSEGAQSKLAVIYFNGLYGVKANSYEAVKYITKAVNAGDTSAQCNLGLAYKNGLGVKKDLFKAYKWFYIAAHYNYEKAIQNIEILNSQISAGDKETAVQEAKEWIKTHKEMNMELTTAGLIKPVSKDE